MLRYTVIVLAAEDRVNLSMEMATIFYLLLEEFVGMGEQVVESALPLL